MAIHPVPSCDCCSLQCKCNISRKSELHFTTSKVCHIPSHEDQTHHPRNTLTSTMPLCCVCLLRSPSPIIYVFGILQNSSRLKEDRYLGVHLHMYSYSQVSMYLSIGCRITTICMISSYYCIGRARCLALQCGLTLILYSDSEANVGKAPVTHIRLKGILYLKHPET
jgi:hypothetical protein